MDDKAIILAALVLYKEQITAEPLPENYTKEDVAKAFEVWESVNRLIRKYSK